ncbi:hypothetical protein ACUTJJ_14045 [Agrobacterium sp. DKPNP3]|uniref:hypothetical protein n=1 Tax=Agrobacterium sp. DKPNP3 TaxID=3457323 RepID=UPI0040440EF1
MALQPALIFVFLEIIMYIRIFILSIFSILTASSAWAFDLSANAEKAAAIVSQNGIEKGAQLIEAAGTELVDMKAGKGLHVWSMNDAGHMLFDFSGQTKPGDDLNDFVLSDGSKLVAMIKEKLAAGNGKGVIELGPELPNPTTNSISPSKIACVALASKDVVCAMAWD